MSLAGAGLLDPEPEVPPVPQAASAAPAPSAAAPPSIERRVKDRRRPAANWARMMAAASGDTGGRRRWLMGKESFPGTAGQPWSWLLISGATTPATWRRLAGTYARMRIRHRPRDHEQCRATTSCRTLWILTRRDDNGQGKVRQISSCSSTESNEFVIEFFLTGEKIGRAHV